MKTEQENLIAAFIKAEQRYEIAKNAMVAFFEKKHTNAISQATNLSELLLIKNELREMPNCAGKVLVFRRILIKEGEIKFSKTFKS